METHQVIVAVLIAVTGWIITHVLSIRVQNKNFKNVVMNNARLDIMKAIRDYQDWLMKVATAITMLPVMVTVDEKKIMAVNWSEKLLELGDLFYKHKGKPSVNWIYRLEEYDILFPSLRDCRLALGNLNLTIGHFLEQLTSNLIANATLDKANERKESITKASDNVGIVYDQIFLMQDLMVILQDICLSSITKNKIPERKPEDPNAVRLIKGKNGKIEIYDPKIKPASGSNG